MVKPVNFGNPPPVFYPGSSTITGLISHSFLVSESHQVVGVCGVSMMVEAGLNRA